MALMMPVPVCVRVKRTGTMIGGMLGAVLRVYLRTQGILNDDTIVKSRFLTRAW